PPPPEGRMFNHCSMKQRFMLCHDTGQGPGDGTSPQETFSGYVSVRCWGKPSREGHPDKDQLSRSEVHRSVVQELYPIETKLIVSVEGRGQVKLPSYWKGRTV